MAEKCEYMLSKKRKIMIGAVLVVGILITSIWAWNLWKSQEKEEENSVTYPIRVAMVVDSKNNVHIAFGGGYTSYYIKLNESGVVQITKRILSLTPSNLCDWLPPSIAIDNMGCVHIIYQHHYFKLDNNGNELLNLTLMNFTSTGRVIPCTSSLAIDMDGCVHIVIKEGYAWVEGALQYIKLDSNGNVLARKVLANYTEAEKVDVKIDSLNYIHIIWSKQYNSYYIKLDNNGNIVIPEHSIAGSNAEFVIDSENYIHLFWAQYQIKYLKLDTNGTPLFDFKYIYNGTSPSVDISSQGYIYVSWDDRGTDVTYGIFYAKLDNNGSFLVPPANVSFSFEHPVCYPDITVDSNNNILLAYGGAEQGKEAVYFMKLDSEGNVIIPEMRIYEWN